MAQRVLVVVDCDKHADDKDESVPGREWTMTWRAPDGRLTTRVVDVCEDCEGPLVESASLMLTYGRTQNGGTPRRKSAAQPEPEPEPEPPALDYVCETCGKGFAKPQGLSMHRTRVEH